MRDMESALSLLQSALAIAEPSGDEPVLAESMWNLAQVHFYCGRVLVALPYAERALEFAQKLDLSELIARTQNLLAYLTGNPSAGPTQSAVCGGCPAALRPPGRSGYGGGLLESDRARQCRSGPAAAAVRAGQTAVRIADEIENGWGQVSTRFSLGVALLEAGEHATALAFAQEALAIGQAHAFDVILPVAQLVLGNIQRACGDSEGSPPVAPGSGTHQCPDWITISAPDCGCAVR